MPKATSLVAKHFMLEKRGVLEVGNYADVNVFDINALKINATFTDPCRYSEGMRYVIVNGVPVIQNGEHTGARSGRVLRHKAVK
jgi:N-acyl-D-amino-acid deacylase